MPPRRRISAAETTDGPLAEQQHRQAQDDVNANLTQDREHAGDGRRGRTVGGGQPEAERPHADLMRKATPSTAAPASIRINRSASMSGMRKARSAMLSVPAVP